MPKKAKAPTVPSSREATPRRAIIRFLQSEHLEQEAKQISKAVGVSEKEVYSHLSHIEKSLKSEGLRLEVSPAECQKCDFVFEKRGKFSKPGRCPECKQTRIYPPVFRITEK